jgi:membrane-associated phospholipid phosphatase
MIRYVKKGIKKFWAALMLLSLELVVVFAVFFSALFLFILLARMIFWNNKYEFDISVFAFFSKYVSAPNSDLMQFVTFLGSHYFLVAANILLVAYFLFLKKHKWYAIKIPVISLSSLLIMLLLKQIFNRQRPDTPLLEAAMGLSFPSGHAMMSLSFYGLLIYISYISIQVKWVKWIMISVLGLLILSIGLSRIYLRVHYASDVIAGFCIGIMWLFISVIILNKMERVGKKEIDVLVEE